MRVRILLTVVFCSLIGISACKHKLTEQPEPVDDYGNFPEAVGKIFITKCATAGCHNDKSYTGAGDLRLDRWDYMFSGAKNGAPVVPYSPEQSSLLFFINTDSTLGLTAPASQMPKDAPPLSREEYLIIRDWVANGAPDKDGNVPFASNPSTRQKIYITQQGCDLIAVVDAEKKMVMRYIKVGMDDSRTEAPHNVKFTADGKYAYVCFSTGNYLQKIDATTDQVVGSIDLRKGTPGNISSFNVLSISMDGTQVLVSDWVQNGNLLLVDAVGMQVVGQYNGIMTNPHGVIANQSFDTFFVTSQSGNIIYRLSKDGDLKVISLDGNPPTTVSTSSTPDPHDLVMAPDYSKYFVTCQGSNQVKVVDAHSDKILATIPVGKFPQELAVSAKTKKVFVTCMQGPSAAGSLFSGNVYAIDLETYSTQIIEAKFSGPHGVAVDDINGFLYVSSTNTIGPAPHHPSACAGNNGYYQVFDMNNGYAPYTGTDRRYETSVQPYSADARFKKAN